MQAQTSAGRQSPFPSSWACAKYLYSTGGLRSLNAGLVATLSREVPQFMFYYPVYEFMKGRMQRGDGTGEPSALWIMLIAGGVAGASQWVPPFVSIDVIKSRIQAAKNGDNHSMLVHARHIWHKQGARGFVRGFVPLVLMAFPRHAVILAVYELLMRTWAGENREI